MPSTTSNPDADMLAPITKCEASWSAQKPCPNSVTHVVVNAKRPGYCPVCKPHADGWPKDNVARGESVVLTLEKFEDLRQRGLYTQYNTPFEVPQPEGCEL